MCNVLIIIYRIHTSDFVKWLFVDDYIMLIICQPRHLVKLFAVIVEINEMKWNEKTIILTAIGRLISVHSCTVNRGFPHPYTVSFSGPASVQFAEDSLDIVVIMLLDACDVDEDVDGLGTLEKKT